MNITVEDLNRLKVSSIGSQLRNEISNYKTDRYIIERVVGGFKVFTKTGSLLVESINPSDIVSYLNAK